MQRRQPVSKLPLSARQFSDLILGLHAVAIDPRRLRDFIAACCDYVGARISTLALVETATARMRYIEFYPEVGTAGREYEETWADRDPMKAAILRAEPRKFYIRDHLIRPEEQACHPFYSEWCAGHRFDEVCIARIPVGGAFHCNWGVIRDRNQPRFSAAEIAFLDTLLPHVEAMLLLHHRLDRLSLFADIAREQFRHSGNGVVILSRSGSMLFSDDVARDFLADPRVFLVQGRRLRLSDEAANRRFAKLVEQSIAVADSNSMLAGGTVRAPVKGSDHSLLVGVMPLRSGAAPPTYIVRGGRAVLSLFDVSRAGADIRAELRAFYRLSVPESEVCWRLASGETLARIADETGVTRETVRSQLKRIFAKTGTNRQPELVRLVVQGPSSWIGVVR